ncbi:MAG: helix-turn-helix domain-containing protein [bacterium]
MIENNLKDLGFSEKEISIYLALLKRGKALPSEIAKLTGLNRSTVYSVAGELIKRGVITEDLGGPVRYFAALPPEELMGLADRESQALSKKKKLIEEAIGSLKVFSEKATYSPPKIVFKTQEEISSYLHKRTDEWNRSILKSDKTWWGFQDHTFVETHQDWINWYWAHVPDDLHLSLLSNKSETETQMKQKKYDHREIRFWKEADEFTSTVWVCGDYLIMIITRSEPYSLVEIHDAVLAKNMREVFKGIWRGTNKK